MINGRGLYWKRLIFRLWPIACGKNNYGLGVWKKAITIMATWARCRHSFKPNFLGHCRVGARPALYRLLCARVCSSTRKNWRWRHHWSEKAEKLFINCLHDHFSCRRWSFVCASTIALRCNRPSPFRHPLHLIPLWVRPILLLLRLPPTGFFFL